MGSDKWQMIGFASGALAAAVAGMYLMESGRHAGDPVAWVLLAAGLVVSFICFVLQASLPKELRGESPTQDSAPIPPMGWFTGMNYVLTLPGKVRRSVASIRSKLTPEAMRDLRAKPGLMLLNFTDVILPDAVTGLQDTLTRLPVGFFRILNPRTGKRQSRDSS